MLFSRIAFLSAPALLGLLGHAAVAASPVSTEAFSDRFEQISRNSWYVSNGWTNGPHQSCEWRPDALATTSNGLMLELSDRGGKLRPIGCGELHTNKLYTYGLYEARMRSAAGSGLNTAFFTYTGAPESKEHNEIDFEFLGKDPHFVQVNYFIADEVKHGYMVPLGFDASKAFHDYAFDWEPTKITWYVDGKPVHETETGAAMPTIGSHIFFSLWSNSPNLDDWMGHFTYTAPVTGEVAWVSYTPPGQKCIFPHSMTCQ